MTSLVKTAASTETLLGAYDLMSDVRRKTEKWLKDACDNQIDIEEVVGKILKSDLGEKKDNEIGKKGKKLETLSVPQRCEWWENEHVLKLMSLSERNWIKANTITHLSWIRALPLAKLEPLFSRMEGGGTQTTTSTRYSCRTTMLLLQVTSL